MKKSFHLLKILIAGLAIATGILPIGMASAAGYAEVSVSGPGAAGLGKQITIEINVDPGTAIAGMQFNLSYDPSLITVDRVIEGGLLSQGGAGTYFSSGNIDNSAGIVAGVSGAITSPGQSVSSSGTFALISMTTSMLEGNAGLTLSGVVLGDMSGQAVSTTIANGSVSITSNAIENPDTLNSPPVLDPIGDQIAVEGRLLKFTISASDPDGDTLSYTAANLPAGARFNAVTGVFSWSPKRGTQGTYSQITFSVSDSEYTVSEEISINVLSRNSVLAVSTEQPSDPGTTTGDGEPAALDTLSDTGEALLADSDSSGKILASGGWMNWATITCGAAGVALVILLAALYCRRDIHRSPV